MKNGLLKNQEQGEGNVNPLQYSCLGNLMDRGPWWATVHWVTKSWTWQSDWTTATNLHSTYVFTLLFHFHQEAF